MNAAKSTSEHHVLPRPVERLPDYAHAKARQTLAERLVEAFGLSEVSATVIANAVVDPSEVRKAIGDPTDPETEKIPVPGGTLLGIRTAVWARRVMPDPRNPRTLPSRRHPFAVDPGAGAEDSKFRPVPEPRSQNEETALRAELVVDIESRHHLTWASQLAATYVLSENDWRTSIASQGVMEAVWLVSTTYQHEDGSSAATALVTAEGSSRVTAVHDHLQIRSADVAYDDNDAKLRAQYKKLNEAVERGPTGDELVALRCERIPALILVGFRPYPSSDTRFPTAVKSLVALRHVDPPTPWGEGPENESLADEVLDELYRRGLISATDRSYFGGSCTRAEARAARLSDDPVVRAARIVRQLTSLDERVVHAIRLAVTSQSTRKRLTPKLSNELATALIVRAIADDRSKTDQIRRYLRHSFGAAVHRNEWQSTNRDTNQLVTAALTEVRESLAREPVGDPGPSSLELAVRAAYPLVVSGRLTADRGSMGNEQPDRRRPGEVLDAMRRTVQGVHQLGQALVDFADGQPIRAVDEEGRAKNRDDNSGPIMINDVYLRAEFPPPGKVKTSVPGDTPLDRYRNGLATLSDTFAKVEQAFRDMSAVVGDDGRSLVDSRGVDPRICSEWRELLGQIDEELVVWSRTFRKTFGPESISVSHSAEATETSMPDEGDDEDEGSDVSEPRDVSDELRT
jgi:hypothetical protein